MTPDQKFARYVRLSLVGFILVFLYYVIADIWLPVTPQAQPLDSRIFAFTGRQRRSGLVRHSRRDGANLPLGYENAEAS